jgi:WD40 repeat protein
MCVNLCYTGGWDRAVKFWDIRTDSLSAQINSVQICGDSVDMSKNNMQVVTGGGSMGEGIRLWDMRKLGKPIRQFFWENSN